MMEDEDGMASSHVLELDKASWKIRENCSFKVKIKITDNFSKNIFCIFLSFLASQRERWMCPLPSPVSATGQNKGLGL